ncbi:MAG: hypothetical protein AAF614_01980 [Chloroflexota bacterium]
MANIVLATSLLWPEPASDAPLRQALAARAHTAVSAPWNGHDQTPFYAADLVVLRSCWDYFKAPKQFLAWLDQLEQGNVRVRNRLPLVRWNFDKSYLLELSKAGFYVPKTRVVEPRDHAAIRSIMDQQGWQKAVRKPTSGQSGRYVDFLERADVALWPQSAMPTAQALLQEFQADAAERGETLLVFFNGTFSYAIQRLPNSPAGPDREQVTVPVGIIHQAKEILAFLPEMPLYARVDGLIRGDRFLLMELELIEPSFAFEVAPGKAMELVLAIEQVLLANSEK